MKKEDLISYIQKDCVEIEEVDTTNEIEERTSTENGREFFATGKRVICIDVFDEEFSEKDTK